MSRSLTLTALVGLIGTFLIPGVGTAVITTTGKILIGGVAIESSSWLDKKVAE